MTLLEKHPAQPIRRTSQSFIFQHVGLAHPFRDASTPVVDRFFWKWPGSGGNIVHPTIHPDEELPQIEPEEK